MQRRNDCRTHGNTRKQHHTQVLDTHREKQNGAFLGKYTLNSITPPTSHATANVSHQQTFSASTRCDTTKRKIVQMTRASDSHIRHATLSSLFDS
jgi:hypothetical protein